MGLPLPRVLGCTKMPTDGRGGLRVRRLMAILLRSLTDGATALSGPFGSRRRGYRTLWSYLMTILLNVAPWNSSPQTLWSYLMIHVGWIPIHPRAFASSESEDAIRWASGWIGWITGRPNANRWASRWTVRRPGYSGRASRWNCYPPRMLTDGHLD